jgi:hypothetical protein
VSAIRRAWRRSTILRYLAVVYLIIVAVAAGMLAIGALSNLWAEYQDSETRTYLVIGLPALGVCVAALFAAVQIWRDSPTRGARSRKRR